MLTERGYELEVRDAVARTVTTGFREVGRNNRVSLTAVVAPAEGGSAVSIRGRFGRGPQAPLDSVPPPGAPVENRGTRGSAHDLSFVEMEGAARAVGPRLLYARD